MAGKSPDQLANRILRNLGWGALAGVLTLVLGPKIGIPDGAQTLLKTIGIHSSDTALDVMRGLASSVFEPVGKIFLRLLFFVILPLVFSSLASGVVQVGGSGKLGALAGRTFSLFLLNMGIGVALGLAMMNLLNPGSYIDDATKAALMNQFGGSAQKYVEGGSQGAGLTFAGIVDMFLPANLFGTVTGQNRGQLGEVLPLILFAILVGVAGTMLAETKRRKLMESLDLVTELMTGIVHMALRFAPYAVPCLIYSVLVRSGFEIIMSLGVFVAGCAGVMALHLFATTSLWLVLWTKWSPLAYFAATKEVLVTAFSTSSSNATLPTAIDTATTKLGVSPSTAGFVLPLGATMNMSGTALYEGCVVLFVAQVFGVDLSFGQQITLLVLSVLSAVAVAGIPGGSLPLIAGLLVAFKVPPDGIGLILGTDRILDMCRTTLNVSFDLTTCVVVDARLKKKASIQQTADQ